MKRSLGVARKELVGRWIACPHLLTGQHDDCDTDDGRDRAQQKYGKMGQGIVEEDVPNGKLGHILEWKALTESDVGPKFDLCSKRVGWRIALAAWASALDEQKLRDVHL